MLLTNTNALLRARTFLAKMWAFPRKASGAEGSAALPCDQHLLRDIGVDHTELPTHCHDFSTLRIGHRGL